MSYQQKIAFARKMRKNPTEPEAVMWMHLRKRQLGVRFTRQKVMAGYILDFICHEKKLVVEIDGKMHNRQYDWKRDAIILKKGFKTHRIPAWRVYNALDGVLDELRGLIDKLPTFAPSHILKVASSKTRPVELMTPREREQHLRIKKPLDNPS